jgi:hypothetical protein
VPITNIGLALLQIPVKYETLFAEISSLFNKSFKTMAPTGYPPRQPKTNADAYCLEIPKTYSKGLPIKYDITR